MALGYLPIAFTIAVITVGQGASPTNAILMSILIYGGASQIVAMKMMEAGASAASIVLTTGVVNLRHLLMSSALGPRLRHFKTWQLALFSFQLTDEAFALHSAELAREPAPSKTETLSVNIFLHVAWVIGSVAGALLGTSRETLAQFGLDIAPQSMFMALLALLVKDKFQAGVAIFSGFLAVLLTLMGLDSWSVIVTTLIGASLGVGAEQWTNKKFS